MSTDYALDDFPIGLVVTSIDASQIVMATPYFYEICQQSPEADARMGQFVSRASKILIQSFVMPMLLHQGHCDEVQLTLTTSRGERVPVLANVKVVHGEPSLIYWAISVAQQRDSLYQQLVDLRNDLEVRAEKLELLSQTDELTGLLNRRAFTERAHTLIKQAQRSQLSYSFLMLDIDYFKRINDEHGHDVGDRVLHEVAAMLALNTRGNDILARVGGEEFAIITLDQGEHAALQLAEKLLNAIRKQPIQGLNVTASVGCATSMTASFEQLYKQADIFLYQAKNLGRDQVVCHS